MKTHESTEADLCTIQNCFQDTMDFEGQGDTSQKARFSVLVL